MGLFNKLFGKGRESTADNEKKAAQFGAGDVHTSSKAIIENMVRMADKAMEKGDFAAAADQYKNILKLEPNETAQYNLGSLYAQGKGVEQDFMEAAYWFRQAELSGDEQAGRLCLKCTMDFVHHDFDSKTPEQLYTDMVRFIRRVYPEKTDVNLEVCRKLYGVAGNHFNKKEYVAAVKLFRAAAEFGNDGYSQNYLAVLLNAGAGIGKNDLAALYWFDKAVDNGAADVAQKDRDGMLNAYKTNFTPAEFYEEMMKLSGWCSVGSKDVPKDAVKAVFWREVGEDRVKAVAAIKE